VLSKAISKKTRPTCGGSSRTKGVVAVVLLDAWLCNWGPNRPAKHDGGQPQFLNTGGTHVGQEGAAAARHPAKAGCLGR
jgi:hypothetical protein